MTPAVSWLNMTCIITTVYARPNQAQPAADGAYISFSLHAPCELSSRADFKADAARAKHVWQQRSYCATSNSTTSSTLHKSAALSSPLWRLEVLPVTASTGERGDPVEQLLAPALSSLSAALSASEPASSPRPVGLSGDPSRARLVGASRRNRKGLYAWWHGFSAGSSIRRWGRCFPRTSSLSSQVRRTSASGIGRQVKISA
mmetsp:Transcript_38904/g.81664  ORF Transcript_38904/g.81664 Transcript_38904/m.81664 type:complete len:202 (+) Transcript_38904:195-800(+)